MSDKIKELAFQIESDIINIRRQIHKNPELALHEFETAKLVSKKLNELGFEVTENVGITGVVGLLRGKGPGRTVAIRADMDALPIQEQTDLEFRSVNDNVMHACGHDAHTAILLGAATILSKIKDSIKGNVKFIFQPSEESGIGGATEMIEEGVLENPKVDSVLGLHVSSLIPWGKIGYREGAINSSAAGFEIEIIGKGGHGSAPHEAIDAIIIASEVVQALQTISSSKIDPRETFVLTVGTINGGCAANVIADRVSLTGTIRYFNPEIISKVGDIFGNIIKYITAAYGATYNFKFRPGIGSVINDSKTVNIVANAAIEIVGVQNVLIVPQSLGSEDFAAFALRVPSAFINLGVGFDNKENYPGHHPKFDIDEKALPIGAAVLANSAIKFLNN